jgi:hypothetical protein
LVLTLQPTDSRGQKLIRDFAIPGMRQNAGVRCAPAPEVCSWRELLVGQGANRIQREIEEYKARSQQVMQLTKIISEGVQNSQRLPTTTAVAGSIAKL